MSHSLDTPALLENLPASENPTPLSTINTSDSLFSLPWLTTWILLFSASAFIASLLVIASHGAHGYFLPTLALLVCTLASLFDAWTRRIPNHLTYPAILIGLFLNSISPLFDKLHAHTAFVWLDSAGPGSSFAAFGICLALGLITTAIARDHGGDLKILLALAALLGFFRTVEVLIVAINCAVIYAVLNLLARGTITAVLRRGALALLELFYFRKLQTPISDSETLGAWHIPMAIPLALGLIITQVYQWRTGRTLL